MGAEIFHLYKYIHIYNNQNQYATHTLAKDFLLN